MAEIVHGFGSLSYPAVTGETVTVLALVEVEFQRVVNDYQRRVICHRDRDGEIRVGDLICFVEFDQAEVRRTGWELRARATKVEPLKISVDGIDDVFNGEKLYVVTFVPIAGSYFFRTQPKPKPAPWTFSYVVEPGKPALELKACPRCRRKGEVSVCTEALGGTEIYCSCGYRIGFTTLLAAMRKWNGCSEAAERHERKAQFAIMYS